MTEVPQQKRTPAAMTIAGMDPGSGAGVTADVLTFARFGIFATAAVTALTVQSTRGVRRVELVDADLLRETLEELEADLPPDGIKIGMLGGPQQVRVVCEYLRVVRARRAVAVVLDPVLLSSSGAVLLEPEGLELLRTQLLPLADATTPNAAEASLLTGLPCSNLWEAERCAEALAKRYPGLVPVVTGGHLEPPADVVWQAGAALRIPGQRILSRSTHGTGCVFSSALLSGRLLGRDWPGAALGAKGFVTAGIERAEPRGAGFGPLYLLRE